MINLAHWCNHNDVREYARRPYNFKGMTVASNGHILIFTPAGLDNSYQELNPKLTPKGLIPTYWRILKYFEEPGLMPFPKSLALPEPITCPVCQGCGKVTIMDCEECEGQGFVEFDSGFHEYEAICKGCGGDSKVAVASGDTEYPDCNGIGAAYAAFVGVEIDGGHYQAKYLSLIINEPDLLYKVRPDDLTLLFKSGANFGAIMPYKP